jgi:hypothetical protein
MPLRSSIAAHALIATCALTLLPTVSFGACNATLRGELVPYDDPRQLYPAVPQKLLSFGLSEVVEENGQRLERNFQSFAFENSHMTFPIPFVLNIDSPKDCPKELNLYVTGSNHAGFHHEFPLHGMKKVRLDEAEFQRVVVAPPSF